MAKYKLFAGYAFVIPALIITSACSRTRTDESRGRTAPQETIQKTAFVRFIDAHTGGANLYFGDLQAFSGNGTSKVTEYKQLPAERRQFELRAANQASGEALATNSEGLDAGKHYTVIAFDDKDGKANLRVVNDDESAPDAGKAKVRIIHAAPGMDAVNLYAAGKKDEIASETRFTTASTWQEVDPVSGPLTIRTSDKKSGAVKIPDVTLQAGKLYTFVVEGGAKAGEKLRVTPIVDMPTKS